MGGGGADAPCGEGAQTLHVRMGAGTARSAQGSTEAGLGHGPRNA